MNKYFIIAFAPLISLIVSSCEKEVDSVSDIEGNVYSTVNIGSQVWMAENLKTSKFSNGDLIWTTDPATKDIRNETNPKYQWSPMGKESNVELYGRLYTWYTINDNRNVCPSGWHVPSDTEWQTLSDYLTKNGFSNEYGIAKSLVAQSGWNTSQESGSIYNDQSNNSSGFSAKPNGKRYDYKDFIGIGYICSWWSSTETESDASTSYYREIHYLDGNLSKSITDKPATAFGVRCLKD